MKPNFSRAALVIAALSLAACQEGNAGRDPDATVPAGTQPASTAQTQAAPQTGANTPEASAAGAPPADGTTGAPAGRTYADCMADAGSKAKNEGEREVLERTCRSLPGAPKP